MCYLNIQEYFIHLVLYRAISVSEEFNLSFIIYAFDAVIITQEATMTTNRGRHIYAPVFIIT